MIGLCLNCFENQPGNDADAAVAVGDDAMPRKPIVCTQVPSPVLCERRVLSEVWERMARNPKMYFCDCMSNKYV